MSGSTERVRKAFAHEQPDRTPLFEIFCKFHPIHWDITGRNVATDAIMYWDALAAGIDWDELIEAEAQAIFKINSYFGLDMVRVGGNIGPKYGRPVKTGETSWTLSGVDYIYNERTALVEPAVPMADSAKITEEERLAEIERFDGTTRPTPPESFAVLHRVQELAQEAGLDWVYMGEIGAGTGVAFYPPFMLMWLATEPELVDAWLETQKVPAFARTVDLIEQGCSVIAIGGDVSCDKGPFISPEHYRRYILPVIQEHVAIIHEHGALAVYTADGNHWDIKDDFFFNSNVDGYKEVDKAAGMTWPRLIEEGINRHLCIIGNLDARHTLCLGTPDDVRAEVIECLRHGQESPGGHILHASHSVHEDVKVESYYAAVDAYRAFFGIAPLI
jgi:hypothetical protein